MCCRESVDGGKETGLNVPWDEDRKLFLCLEGLVGGGMRAGARLVKESAPGMCQGGCAHGLTQVGSFEARI